MAPQLYESQLLYNDEDAIYGAIWWGQTFQALVGHLIYSVKIVIRRRAGSPGNLVIGIRTGGVSGTEICSGTYNTNPLTVNVYTVVEVVMTSNPEIVANQTYGIVARIPTGGGSSYCSIVFRNTNVYPRGNMHISTNSGGSWSNVTTKDLYFQDWGIEVPAPDEEESIIPELVAIGV